MFHRPIHQTHSISHHFLTLLHLSTTTQPPHFMIPFLTTTLNLSTPQATSITSKIPHLKTLQNPQSVITFLTNHNLTTPQIKSTNVELLERYGVCGKDIERVILRNPRLVTQSPVRLEEKLVEVEREFGITPGSSMFTYGLAASCSMNKVNFRRKVGVFKGFGWGEAEVFAVVRSQPLVLTHSEERLRTGLGFFMGELGLTAEWLSRRGNLLMYSLEKRVKPRYSVYVVLKEKGLMTRELHTLMCLSDADFVKNVVLRHREDMPKYLTTIGNQISDIGVLQLQVVKGVIEGQRTRWSTGLKGRIMVISSVHVKKFGKGDDCGKAKHACGARFEAKTTGQTRLL
ncbi:hypothetical protein M8C21_002724, partial [Ambrosia artemisiifolia]